MCRRFVFLFAAVVLVLGFCEGLGAEVRGVYKLPGLEKVHPSTYVDKLERAGVNAVFVPDEKTAAWFKKQGFSVYVSVAAMRKRGAWEDFWGARLVDEQGRLLNKHPQGTTGGWICPSHQGWRDKRLGDIEKLLQAGDKERVDGIWLDYIRYPGRWSKKEPSTVNTCFCPRCIQGFIQLNIEY